MKMPKLKISAEIKAAIKEHSYLAESGDLKRKDTT